MGLSPMLSSQCSVDAELQLALRLSSPALFWTKKYGSVDSAHEAHCGTVDGMRPLRRCKEGARRRCEGALDNVADITAFKRQAT